MRFCKKCQSSKKDSEFYVKTGYICKSCVIHRSVEWERTHKKKAAEKKKQWAEANPDKVIAASRRRQLKLFNLTEKDYQSLLHKQQGKCAICDTVFPGGAGKNFAVDHCHETGLIRGLLCFACNTGIGKLKDNAELLIKAAQYLQGKV